MIFIYQYFYCAPIGYASKSNHSHSDSCSRSFVMSANGKGYISIKDTFKSISFCSSHSQNRLSSKLIPRIESKVK
jgi:hypothetical protein